MPSEHPESSKKQRVLVFKSVFIPIFNGGKHGKQFSAPGVDTLGCKQAMSFSHYANILPQLAACISQHSLDPTSRQDRCAKGKCDCILSSSKINTGTPQTTLGQVGLAVRRGVGDGRWWITDAWHTDHKQNPHTGTELSLLGHSKALFTVSRRTLYRQTLICDPKQDIRYAHFRSHRTAHGRKLGNKNTYTDVHQMHAGAHLSPLLHLSSPPYLRRGVFLRAIVRVRGDRDR